MLRKILNFFEVRIDKIILVIVLLLCAWLFVTHVMISPNLIEHKVSGKPEMESPGAIDEQILTKQALVLKEAVYNNANQEKTEQYKPRASGFLAHIDSALKGIDTALVLPNPRDVKASPVDLRKYRKPEIGQLADVAIEYIRGAAYVPAEPVTATRTYSQAKHEVKDIDLVTVQCKYDIAALCERLRNNYVTGIPDADPCLAKPIFASVNLQRRQLNANGSLSEWQNVPRSKTDYNRQTSQIIDSATNLAPAVQKLQTVLFNDSQIQIELLQPPVYQFASGKEQWYPPLLHRDYLKAVSKEASQQKKEATEKEQSTDTNRRGRSSTTSTSSVQGNTPVDSSGTRARGGLRGTTSSGTGGALRGSTQTGTTTTGTTRGGRRGAGTTETTTTTTTTQEVEKKPTELVAEAYDKILLTLSSNFAKLKEPVVIWAVDDTVEEGQAYQYRMRIGIFNPVFNDDNDEAIFWSEFSRTTDTVEIPRMLYFFAQSVQEAAKTVTVAIYRYLNGYWRTASFKVMAGEQIGRVIEPEYKITTDSTSGSSSSTTTLDQAMYPESIDFSTGKVMLDLVAVNDSDPGNLNSRGYYNMLYSDKKSTSAVEQMPVGASYWPEAIRKTHSFLLSEINNKKEPLKNWNSTNRF
jgi:hypothetical protein